MAAACCAFIEEHRFRVQVIGERYGEEKQDKRATHRGPFAKGSAAASRFLAHPTRAPHTYGTRGNQEPKQIEEQFHFVTLNSNFKV